MLPSEFKNQWEELVKEGIIDAFADYLDQPQIMLHVIQDVFLLIYNTFEKKYEALIKQISSVLFVKSQHVDALKKSILAIIQDNCVEIFSFADEYYTGITNALIPIIKQYITTEPSTFFTTDFKKFCSNIHKLCTHMILSEPIIAPKILEYSIRKDNLEYVVYSKLDHYCIDGFPKDDSVCVVVVPPPFRNNFAYQGIKPSVMIINSPTEEIIHKAKSNIKHPKIETKEPYIESVPQEKEPLSPKEKNSEKFSINESLKEENKEKEAIELSLSPIQNESSKNTTEYITLSTSINACFHRPISMKSDAKGKQGNFLAKSHSKNNHSIQVNSPGEKCITEEEQYNSIDKATTKPTHSEVAAKKAATVSSITANPQQILSFRYAENCQQQLSQKSYTNVVTSPKTHRKDLKLNEHYDISEFGNNNNNSTHASKLPVAPNYVFIKNKQEDPFRPVAFSALKFVDTKAAKNENLPKKNPPSAKKVAMYQEKMKKYQKIVNIANSPSRPPLRDNQPYNGLDKENDNDSKIIETLAKRLESLKKIKSSYFYKLSDLKSKMEKKINSNGQSALLSSNGAESKSSLSRDSEDSIVHIEDSRKKSYLTYCAYSKKQDRRAGSKQATRPELSKSKVEKDQDLSFNSGNLQCKSMVKSRIERGHLHY